MAEGRSLSAEAARAAAKGRVWSGADALRLGLVDRLGGLQDAVDWARAAVPGPLVPPPPPPPPQNPLHYVCTIYLVSQCCMRFLVLSSSGPALD